MSLELLVASAVAALTAAGIYLALRARTFSVVLGLAMLSYAVNVFLFATGRLVVDRPPIFDKAAQGTTDPLPQALVLTAIVISFGSSPGVLVTIAEVASHLRVYRKTVDKWHTLRPEFPHKLELGGSSVRFLLSEFEEYAGKLLKSRDQRAA